MQQKPRRLPAAPPLFSSDSGPCEAHATHPINFWHNFRLGSTGNVRLALRWKTRPNITLCDTLLWVKHDSTKNISSKVTKFYWILDKSNRIKHSSTVTGSSDFIHKQDLLQVHQVLSISILIRCWTFVTRVMDPKRSRFFRPRNWWDLAWARPPATKASTSAASAKGWAWWNMVKQSAQLGTAEFHRYFFEAGGSSPSTASFVEENLNNLNNLNNDLSMRHF